MPAISPESTVHSGFGLVANLSVLERRFAEAEH